jgi:hypothetical protein
MGVIEFRNLNMNIMYPAQNSGVRIQNMLSAYVGRTSPSDTSHNLLTAMKAGSVVIAGCYRFALLSMSVKPYDLSKFFIDIELIQHVIVSKLPE